MTNSPPPDPRSSQTNALGFDEFIAIFVAFTTIGAILFWSLSQRNQGFQLTGILSPSPESTDPTVTQSPQATASPSPAPVLPLFPAVVPTLPEMLTPVPNRTPIPPRIAVIPFSTTPTPTPRSAPRTSPPGQPINFLDVPQDYWARPFIDALSARGIVSGFAGDYFRPERPVTLLTEPPQQDF